MAAIMAPKATILGTDQSHGEQEKDANSQLLELDKGLRSAKSEEQCEAIVRFPRLFEKFPFPILINSAFLKLADVFRQGNNLHRLCILKVIQQSDKHLDKIINVDQLLRKVFQVIHSNDPVARAITIRTLGSCASVIAERKNVHHIIMTALDSHDAVELEASIAAGHQFAAKSKEFAGSVCGKLASMIEGLSTPVDMKLKLLPVFEHMYHDNIMAKKVRELCSRMLPAYPAQSFTLVCLHTLSLLASHCLQDIPEQLNLLMQHLKSDSRKCVKIMVLQDLRLLAKKGPHMWQEETIEDLSSYLCECVHSGLKIGGLNILVELAATPAITAFSTLHDCHSYVLASLCCYDSNPEVFVRATSLLTYMAIHRCIESGDVEYSEQAATAMETHIITLTSDPNLTHTQHVLQRCLQLVVRLCLNSPGMTDRFVDLLVSTLPSVSAEAAELYCHCLAAISCHSQDLLQSLSGDLISAINTVAQSTAHSRDKLLVAIVTLLLQAYVCDGLDKVVSSCVKTVVRSMDPWMGYRIGRSAARYGHHEMAAYIFGSLMTKVSTEHFYFWLSGLRDCSVGEQHLSQLAAGGGVSGCGSSAFHEHVGAATLCYEQALAGLQAASTPGYELSFPVSYSRLRCRYLHTLTQLMKACSSFHTGPPPAIATSLAMTTGLEIHRYGHVVAQLQRSGQQLEQLAAAYHDLRQSTFDADPTTLTSLTLLEQSCKVLLHILDTVLGSFSRGKADSGVGSTSFLTCSDTSLIEHQPWTLAFKAALQALSTAQSQPAEPAPLTHQHIRCVQQVVRLMTCVPLCLPRYYFQVRQQTSIKLAISPQPRGTDPVSVNSDTQLTLKVEGVVQHGKALYREVHKVCITVTASQQQKVLPALTDNKASDGSGITMTRSVAPHNDYFSLEFLLALSTPGLHALTIKTAVEDEHGVVWQTGPQQELSVKSVDEAQQRVQQQQYAQQRQQQRAAAFQATQ